MLASTLRPHCIDQHMVVWRLRRVAQTSSSLGHRKNYPQVRYLNDTSNPLKLPFGSLPGKVQKPLTITGSWPRTITNSCQCSSAAPSHLGGGNHLE